MLFLVLGLKSTKNIYNHQKRLKTGKQKSFNQLSDVHSTQKLVEINSRFIFVFLETRNAEE